MSWTFFLLAPTAIGALFIYFSPISSVKNIGYRILGPWIPVILVITLTIVFGVEGWACWIMIAPLFLIFASFGGLIAGIFKLRKNKKNENLNLSIILLLPFVIGPIENSIPRGKEVYTTYTSIIINADAAKIWGNVTSVREIKPNEDSTKLTAWLGFPKPVKAELDTLAVGGYRKAIFEKGLIFNETVTQYEHEKSMKFRIQANTYDIPSTTLDEHILIGGEYFDMLNGTYKLQRLSENRYNLILYSNFSMKTTFNSYAAIWGNWIMKDIQNNILKVIKSRSETK
ncbi:MAG: hypothetical protein QM783_21115 [Phycisphaerales bacterium]